MPCPYCNDSHSSFDPCPESISAATKRENHKLQNSEWDNSDIPLKFEWLKHFYDANTMEDLVKKMYEHVMRLQEQLPRSHDDKPGYSPREG